MALYNQADYNQALPGTTSQSGATTVTIQNAPVFNSTTYIDLLGILAGLDRMQGESSTDFADRIARAAVLPRGADYIGLMNEICLQFGFDLLPAISLAATGGVNVTVDLAGVHLQWGATALTVPIVAMGPDDFWEWRLLSDVVADLNANSTGLNTDLYNESVYNQSDSQSVATLLIPDGPAFQLVRQSNLLNVIGEDISGQMVKLANPGLVIGTESFNQTVPNHVVTSDSVMRFDSPVPAGTKVTYQYQVYPYSLLASPVFLLGMMDSQLGTLAVTAAGKLVYQMREFVQELATADCSYWAV